MGRSAVVAGVLACACACAAWACGGAAGGAGASSLASPGAPGAPADSSRNGSATGNGGGNGVAAAAPAPAPAAGAAAAAAPASDASAWPFAPAQTDEERSAQNERLKKEPGPVRTNWTPPGKSERYGHAEGLIAAPYDAVRARLVDFAHYRELAGHKFKKVSVVDKHPTGTDLYFQLPIMKGLVTIWYVTRFADPRPGKGGTEVIEGTFVKGNIKGVHFVFTMRPAVEDKSSTVLVCDLLLSLNIPAPQGPLDEELRDACGDAIVNVRAKTTAP